MTKIYKCNDDNYTAETCPFHPEAGCTLTLQNYLITQSGAPAPSIPTDGSITKMNIMCPTQNGRQFVDNANKPVYIPVYSYYDNMNLTGKWYVIKPISECNNIVYNTSFNLANGLMPAMASTFSEKIRYTITDVNNLSYYPSYMGFINNGVPLNGIDYNSYLSNQNYTPYTDIIYNSNYSYISSLEYQGNFIDENNINISADLYQACNAQLDKQNSTIVPSDVINEMSMMTSVTANMTSQYINDIAYNIHQKNLPKESYSIVGPLLNVVAQGLSSGAIGSGNDNNNNNGNPNNKKIY